MDPDPNPICPERLDPDPVLQDRIRNPGKNYLCLMKHYFDGCSQCIVINKFKLGYLLQGRQLREEDKIM